MEAGRQAGRCALHSSSISCIHLLLFTLLLGIVYCFFSCPCHVIACMIGFDSVVGSSKWAGMRVLLHWQGGGPPSSSKNVLAMMASDAAICKSGSVTLQLALLKVGSSHWDEWVWAPCAFEVRHKKRYHPNLNTTKPIAICCCVHMIS